MATGSLAGKDESHGTAGANSSPSTGELYQILHVSLYAIGVDVQKSFDKVLQSCQKSTYLFLYSELRDAAQKYQLWAVNLGLYQSGHTSLDYRFREASSAKSLTVDLFMSLKNALDELNSKLTSCDSTTYDRTISLESDDTSDDSDLDDLNEEPWYQIYIKIVLSSVDRLFRIATKIQNPRLRCTSQRAVAYKEIDPETGVDLMEEYAKQDRISVKEFLSTLQVGKTYVPGVEKLVERLAKANTLRRKQFRVWRTYRINEHPRSRSGINRSIPTAAEALDSTVIHTQDDASTVFGDYSFVKDIVKDKDIKGGQELPIPELPEQLRGEDRFECPYCYILCSKEQGQGHRWRNHVLHDLRPYVCTDLNCQYGDQLFDDLAQWKSHEASHLDRDHEIKENLLGKLCLLCGDTKVNLNHIAAHLEQISVIVLPSFDNYSDDILLRTPASNSSVSSRPVSSLFSKRAASLSLTHVSGKESVADRDLVSTLRTINDLDKLGTEQQHSAEMQATVRSASGNQDFDETFLRNRLEFHKPMSEHGHSDTLTDLVDSALTMRDLGKWDQAEKAQLLVLEARRSKLGPDHHDTLASMCELASIYQSQGEFNKAEELYLRVIETRRLIQGPKHPDALAATTDLVLMYQHQNRWDQAEELQSQILEARMSKPGPNHPDTLASMTELALIYKQQNKLDQAAEIYQWAWEAKRTTLGSGHPSTLASAADLISTHKQQGNWDKPKERQQGSLESGQSRQRSDDAATLAYLDDLKSIYQKQDRWDKAGELQSQVANIRRLKLSSSQPSVLALLDDLRHIYGEQGQWDEYDKLQWHISTLKRSR